MTTPINNHVQLAYDRLLEQYKDSTKLKNLIAAIVAPLQDLEETFGDLESGRSIDTATGTLLDRLGNIVGIARVVGQTDDEYRVAIRTKVVENVSNGEPERLIAFYQLLVGAGMVVLYDAQHGEVGLMSDVDLTDESVINNYYRRVKKASPVGVRVSHLGSFDATEPFAFDGLTSARGFGSTSDALAGGKFGTIYVDRNMEFAFDGSSPRGGGFGTIADPLIGGVFVGL